MRIALLAAILILGSPEGASESPLAIIGGVQVLPGTSPRSIKVTVAVATPCSLWCEILDNAGRHVIVAVLRGPLAEGQHTWTWDGKDKQGKASPPGLYRVLVTGANETGRTDRWPAGPEARTGPMEISATDVKIDRDRGEVAFSLPVPALVKVRLGVRHGLHLATPANWEPRPAGPSIQPFGPAIDLLRPRIPLDQDLDAQVCCYALPDGVFPFGGPVVTDEQVAGLLPDGIERDFRLDVVARDAPVDAEPLVAGPTWIRVARAGGVESRELVLKAGLGFDRVLVRRETTLPDEILFDFRGYPAGAIRVCVNVVDRFGNVGIGLLVVRVAEGRR